ncbi:VOC family protein [Devosia submarina]|uniref:VOC family protein n=1 Tax=Devosia submarina TaxID=1173082 RepID=UPI000D3BCC6F|nr:VOC family protein [Devosia submarina]
MNTEQRTEASRAPSTGIRIGHIHLHVADLDRSVQYYRDVIGFDVVRQMDVAAFLSSDGYHHHVALNTWGTLGMKPDC